METTLKMCVSVGHLSTHLRTTPNQILTSLPTKSQFVHLGLDIFIRQFYSHNKQILLFSIVCKSANHIFQSELHCSLAYSKWWEQWFLDIDTELLARVSVTQNISTLINKWKTYVCHIQAFDCHVSTDQKRTATPGVKLTFSSLNVSN